VRKQRPDASNDRVSQQRRSTAAQRRASPPDVRRTGP